MSMQERARLVGSTLEVRSSPGAGTELTATVPLREDSV
jgi:signal transduction histidine kinase